MADVLKFELQPLPDDMVKVDVFSGEGAEQVFAGDLIFHQADWLGFFTILTLGSNGTNVPVRIIGELRLNSNLVKESLATAGVHLHK